MKKIRITVEIGVEDWYHTDLATIVNLDQDLMRGGALVVTARGSQELGIRSAVVVEIQKLEKDKT